MTDQEWESLANRLINKNGGWLVSTEPRGKNAAVGQHIPITKPSGATVQGLVVGVATVQEADSDCAYIGLPHCNPGHSYVKVMFD